ncbi:MAG: molybdopterin biosynthesis protein [Methanothrix sp.]|jgi:putative molybdopterin biosynthesis protein|nr:molybdopterin biosynthesis protein [Methanothrix sp.]
MRKEFRSLISLEEAQSTVQSRLPRTATESVPLQEARGRMLAEKVVSSMDVPGFARASMDGFAVLAEETLAAREDRPVSLRLAGSVPMGLLPHLRVARGEAAEVSTGSMMPPGADAVVMIEYSQAQGDRVLIRRPVYGGENVQASGSDISFGEAVLFPGTKLDAREIGVLAALGRTEVAVRSLLVGVASTGNELVSPGRPLAAGQIYDINTYTIAAAVADCGALAIPYGILPDEKGALARVLQKMAQECNMILVSGSTSAGVGDMIFQVLEEIGELIFHGVNLKPGKPTIFGLINGKPCLGLPGYPTSALTVFSCLAAPAIRAALGQKHSRKKAAGRLAGPLRLEGRRQMLAVGLSGELVYPVDKGSGSITTLAGADGVIDIPAGVEFLDKGEKVVVELFSEVEPADLVVAGENTLLLEKMAERVPWHLVLLNTGSVQAGLYLEDGVADLACICGPGAAAEGMALIWSSKRELGLVFKDAGVLSNLSDRRIVGWHRDSAMHAAFEQHLQALGLTHPSYVRLARTHSAVAAAVASGRAEVGFAERQAAIDAGLGFKTLGHDEIKLLARPKNVSDAWVKSLVSALSQAGGA